MSPKHIEVTTLIFLSSSREVIGHVTARCHFL